MKKIASFQIDHTKLDIGIYISRIDDDVVTYDVRMTLPNAGCYIEPAAIHTIEHLFATYARNTEYERNILYIGPMGCRTGFYLLTRDLPHNKAIEIIQESMQFILDYQGEIPGASEVECGNYLEHDLEKAKNAVRPLVAKIKDYTVEMLQYSK